MGDAILHSPSIATATILMENLSLPNGWILTRFGHQQAKPNRVDSDNQIIMGGLHSSITRGLHQCANVVLAQWDFQTWYLDNGQASHWKGPIHGPIAVETI